MKYLFLITFSVLASEPYDLGTHQISDEPVRITGCLEWNEEIKEYVFIEGECHG